MDFTKANMRGAKFNNAIITGSVFTDAELSDTSFEDALIGGEDVKRMCVFLSLALPLSSFHDGAFYPTFIRVSAD